MNNHKNIWRWVALSAFALFLLSPAVSPAYAAGTQIIIHYQRTDGEYANWNIWSWASGTDGAAYQWTGENDFGVYAEITLPHVTDRAGFIVRTDAWEKDVQEDRFIDLSAGNEIWVYTGRPEFFYEAPEGYATEAEPIGDMTLIVHYNRYDGQYDGIEASIAGIDIAPFTAAIHSGAGAVFRFDLAAERGLTTRDRLEISFNNNNDVLTIPLRNVNKEESPSASQWYDAPHLDYTLEVFFVSGSRETYYGSFGGQTAALFMMDATLDAPDMISVTTFYPLPVTDTFIVTDFQSEGIVLVDIIPLNEGGQDSVFGQLVPGYATRFGLTFPENLPLEHVFLIEHPSGSAARSRLGNIFDNPHFEEMFFYPGDDLGAVYSPVETRFRLWAPAASEVELVLSPDQNEKNVYPMEKDVNGTWVYTMPGDLNGMFYNYAVTNNGRRAELVDPYAKGVGVNGRWGAVVDLTSAAANPAGWENVRRPPIASPVDAIIYELHVRDFSSHPSSGMRHTGKFLAFTEMGTAAPDGQLTGVEHLKELGITHVHLLPVFDYASLDESLEEPGFNWGYDPLNYNVPEGTYATDAFEPYTRIREFKQMVQALHGEGIGVIMDVVYNHTGPTHDSNLNLAVPGYYYRMNANGTFSNGSGCGNETASERAMVRKFIVDSVVYWAKEYNISGFRFDLMGLHDVDTMNAIRAALDEIDPSIIMYGEGWTGGGSPLPAAQAALKANMHALDARIAAFSDDIRDGIKGSVFNAQEPGWVSGRYGLKEDIKFGVAASVAHPQVDISRVSYSNNFWAKEPTQTVTYASAHDNHTLWDKLQLSTPNNPDEDHLAMNRLAAAIVLTSQGISFIHAGEELARSKGGDENSYRSPDSVNQLRWEHKTERRDLFEYYQGLIALRKAFPAFRMTTAEQIRERIEFLNTEAQIVAYTIQDEKPILVAFNADRNDRELMLPESGSWLIYVNGEKAGKEALGRVGGESMVLAGRSAYVLVYEGAEWVGAVGDEAASEQETAAEGVSGVLGAEPARPIWLYGLVMFFAGLVTGILGVFGGIKIVRYRSRKKEVTS